MAERNEDVLKMIAQLHARLRDLEDDVRAFDGELPDMATRLDRIDDRIYLLETEVASRRDAAATDGAAKASEGASTEAAAASAETPPASSEVSGDKEDNGMNILTPEAKEKIGEFAGDLRSVAKTGAETLADLNEAFSDITSPFKAFTKSGRRR